MKNIVIEFCVRGMDGTKYPSVGFTQDYYYSDDDWKNLHGDTPDEIANVCYYDQGVHGDYNIPVTYYNALIRTEKSIDYWIKLLDAVTYDR